MLGEVGNPRFVKVNTYLLWKPLIGKSNSATARTFAHLRPSPRCPSGAFPLLPRAFRVPSACLPPSARSPVALPLALRVAPCTPLTPLSRPSLATPPSSAPAAPVRAHAATASFCALACRRVLFCRACAALSHAPTLAAPAPCCSPCRPRAGLLTCRRSASGAALVFCASLRSCTAALWLLSLLFTCSSRCVSSPLRRYAHLRLQCRGADRLSAQLVWSMSTHSLRLLIQLSSMVVQAQGGIQALSSRTTLTWS